MPAKPIKRGEVWYTYYWERHGKERRKKWKRLGETASERDISLGDLTGKIRATKYGLVQENKRWDIFCKEYLDIIKDRKAPDGYDRDRRTIQLFNKLIHITYLHEMTPLVGETYIMKRKACIYERKGKKFNISEASINRELTTLKTMVTRAFQWNYLTRDTWVNVKKFNLEDNPPDPFTEEEKTAIYECAADVWELVMCDLTFRDGLRPGESANLKWGKCDLEEKMAVLEGQSRIKNPKKKFKVITLHQKTVEHMNELQTWKNGDWVLGLNDERSTSPYIRRVFKKLCKRAGFPNGFIYKARHKFGRDLMDGNVHMRTIQKLMGHSKITMTQRYTAPDLEMERVAKARIR